jgi:gliding motility-associated-like protein
MIKKLNAYVKLLLVIALVILNSSLEVKAQMVGPNAYIKATSLEIGISGPGGFEGCDMSISPPLAGMHPRTGGTTNFFGFVANPQVNSWATFDGDFFTPGSPENGWGFEIGTAGVMGGNNCNTLQEINGSITSWTHILSCYSATWEGDATSGTDLHFKVNYFLQENDLFYTTTVSITNNTSATIPDMYYYRNLDPDNNQPLTSDYYTQNTIVSQPGTGCNLAHVSATQSAPWLSYLGLAAIGSNWRASYGGFSNRDASDLWTGGAGLFTQTVGSSVFADEAIALAYRIQNLAPGATETFKFVVILDNASATNAINNLLYFSYPGAAGAPSASCSAVSDTVRTCGSSVSIAVQGSNVSDYSWTWSPSTGLSSTTGTSVVANPGSTTTYTASGTPLSSCVSPVVMSVVVEVTPSAGANPVIAAVPPMCISSPPVTLTADSVGGTWTGTGITSPSAGTFDPAVSGIGSFLITYSTPGGCNTTDTVMITVGNTYDATINQPASICLTGIPVNITSVTNGGVWSGTGITDSTAGTFDPTIAGVGFHQITYSLSGVCAAMDTALVEVTTLFDATITQPADVCQYSNPYNLTAAHPGGIWSGIGITDSINGTFDPSISGTQTIYYTISGSCGNSDSVLVNVLFTPEVTIGSVPPLCLTSPAITLTADSSGGVWAGPGITNSSLGTFNPAVAGLGVHYITYAISGLCSTLDTIIITVTTFSDATITQPPSICVVGSPVTLSSVTPGGTWSGTGITNSSTGTFDPTVAGLGLHEITYVITGSCANQDSVMVEVTNQFNANITQPADVCQGSSPFNMIAAHPDGVWTGTNISDSVNGTLDPLIVGTYPVIYSIAGACGNADTVNVTVLPNANATITPVSPMCVDAPPITLSTVTSGGTWSGAGITNPATGVFDPSVSGVGTFTITYGVAGTCGDTATRNITVYALPVPAFSSNFTSGCNPLCVTFTESPSPTCSYIHYDFGDGDTANVSNPTHCYDSSAVFHVTVECTDVYGCRGTTVDSNMITVHPVPVAEFFFTPSGAAAVNTQVVLNNQSTAGTNSYWDFGDGTPFNNSTTTWSPLHYYALVGNYCATLISTTTYGCADTVTHCIDIVDPVIAPPNIFTPNGDGENDTWSMRCPGIGDFSCVIYDRWGIKMTEMKSVAEAEAGWNGKTKGGSPCKDGTYYYVIKATSILDKPIELNGFFQLLGN